MPGIWDRRTKAHKYAAMAAAALGGGILGGGGVGLAHKYSRASYKVPRMRRGRYKRWGRGRRNNPRRRVGRRRGRRFNTRGVKVNKSLNANFSGNDYRTIRVANRVQSGISVTTNVPIVNTVGYAVSYNGLIANTYEDMADKYDEFKVTSVQAVLEPRTVQTSDVKARMRYNNPPYLMVRERDPAIGSSTNSDFDLVRLTPGIKYIPLFKKSRTVFNMKPGLTFRTTMLDGLSEVDVDRHKSMQWLSTSSDEAKKLDLCRFEIITPTMDPIGTDPDLILSWDIVFYATIKFRGNNKNALPY